MTDPHDAERCELQAHAEAIQQQLVLIRRVNPETVGIDLRELEVWLTERLDHLEMQIGGLEFGDLVLPGDRADG